MTKEEIKILRYLSDGLGNGGSILSIAGGIRKRYGKAYYKNIYNAIMKLEKSGAISITTEGKNSLIRLNTKNPRSIYYISEAEDRKAIEMSMQRGMIDELLSSALDSDIISICALKQEEYIKINRIELLIITRSHDHEGRLINSLQGIESMYNTKIDPIILTPQELSEMLEGSELNRIRDLIVDKSILYNSEGFWEIIRKYKIDEKYRNLGRFPDELSGAQLAYNYNRFGYALHEDSKPGREIALEDTIFLMSASKQARIRYGAFILLSKNIRRINLSYTYYLFKRYGELGALKGILITLKELCDEKDKPRIKALIETIPNKQHGIYDRKLVRKYIMQYS
jgi:hypothetical protein